MKKYKLTDENMQTYGGCEWKIGEWKKTSGKGELCGPGWLHCYDSPELAVLLNPIHADIKNPRLFVCETKGKGKHDGGLKPGYTKMRLMKEIPLPKITTEQRVAFGVLCAMEVCGDPKWRKWAKNWLSGKDRTWDAASAAARAIRAIAMAEWVAGSNTTSEAAASAMAASAAWVEVWAAWVAVWAARAVAKAAASAAKVKRIDFVSIVKKALEV